jgi:WD40 repeat protein
VHRTALLGGSADPQAWASTPLAEAAVAGRDRATLTFAPPVAPVTSVAVHPTDPGILAYAAGNTIVITDWRSGRARRVLTGHTGTVWSAAFSPDGTRLTTVGNGGTARIWNTADGTEHTRLTGHGDWVWSAAFSPDGTRLTTAGTDGTVRIWSVPYAWLVVLVALPGSAWAAFRPDGRYTLYGNPAGRIWWAVKLCRFDPGELDPYIRDIRHIPVGEPLLRIPG